jgi:hypothetical protein
MLRWKIRCAAALAGTMLAAAATAAPAWQLGPEGFGPLKFGMRFDQARRASARGIKPTPPPRGNPQKGKVAQVYAGEWAQVQYVEGCL